MSTEKTKRCYCRTCGGVTNHDVLFEKERRYTPENTPGMGIDFAATTWEVAECRGCETVAFLETSINSEDWDFDTGEFDEHVTIYPEAAENLLDIASYVSVPWPLQRIYRETVDAYNRGTPTLCAAGVRALIEGICADKGIDRGPVRQADGTQKIRKNLEGKLQGLVASKLISEDQATTLHELRFIGNEALHELETPSPEALRLAIEIAEHTLEAVYEISAKGKQIAMDRKRRKKSPF